MIDQATILEQLLKLASHYGARDARPESRVCADLNIKGSDFIEFVEEVERRYGVDFTSVSPRDPGAEAQDPTLKALAEAVLRQRV